MQTAVASARKSHIQLLLNYKSFVVSLLWVLLSQPTLPTGMARKCLELLGISPVARLHVFCLYRDLTVGYYRVSWREL